MENSTYVKNVIRKIPIYGLAMFVPLMSSCGMFSGGGNKGERASSQSMSAEKSQYKPIRAEDYENLDSKGVLTYASDLLDAGTTAVSYGMDWVQGQLGIKRYADKYDEDLARREAEAIKNLIKRIEEAKFSEAENNRSAYEPLLKNMIDFVLEKRVDRTIEEILPGVKKEFLRTDVGRKCGPVEKHVLDVFLYTFQIFDKQTSDANSGQMLQTLSDSYEKRMRMPVTYTNKTDNLRMISIHKLAELTGIDISMKGEVGNLTNKLNNVIDKKKQRERLFRPGRED